MYEIFLITISVGAFSPLDDELRSLSKTMIQWHKLINDHYDDILNRPKNYHSVYKKLKYLNENKIYYGIFFKENSSHYTGYRQIDVHLIFDDISDLIMFKLQDFQQEDDLE